MRSVAPVESQTGIVVPLTASKRLECPMFFRIEALLCLAFLGQYGAGTAVEEATIYRR